jgi:serine/threonine protein kinase
MLRDQAARRPVTKDRTPDPALTDPSGRFVRQDDFVTISEGLVRYFACDHETGLEVSWHELILERWPSPEEWPPLEAHFEHLKQSKHDSLFSLHHYWLNSDSQRIVFITDAIPAKSVVEDFLRENSLVRPKVVIRWFRPMLEVLRFLHHLSPPIIHGRIQPFSVFVRGPSIKIDPPHFLRPWPTVFSITPFTPPEVLIGDESPSSDIWRFGMALLCVVARQTPYAECKTPIDLIAKLQACEPPECLAAVEDPMAKDLISVCLTVPGKRLTADGLVAHPYFTQDFSAEAEKVHEKGGLIVIFSSKNAAGNADGAAQEASDGRIPQ